MAGESYEDFLDREKRRRKEGDSLTGWQTHSGGSDTYNVEVWYRLARSDIGMTDIVNLTINIKCECDWRTGKYYPVPDTEDAVRRGVVLTPSGFLLEKTKKSRELNPGAYPYKIVVEVTIESSWEHLPPNPKGFECDSGQLRIINNTVKIEVKAEGRRGGLQNQPIMGVPLGEPIMVAQRAFTDQFIWRCAEEK